MSDGPLGHDLAASESVSESMLSPMATADQMLPEGFLPEIEGAGWRRAVARAAELPAVTLTLIFIAPLLAAIVVLLKTQSNNPALLGDWRIGQDGKRFRCWKFRGAVDGQRSWLDRFLFVSRLDDLPRLLNVFSGEMSLIGPEPIAESEIQKYSSCYQDYVRVRPGLIDL